MKILLLREIRFRELLLLISFVSLATGGCFAQAADAKPSAGVASQTGGRIAGTIVSKADGHPLVRARVTIRDAKNPRNVRSVITAENGKFEFSGLPAGKYSLEGAKRGFISAGYDQHDQYSTAIVTGAGLDTETLVLKLAPDAVITGRVLDETGEPIRHAMVSLYYDDHNEGVDQITMASTVQTNDLGVYEITPLQPGTYFLSASAKPWYAIHSPQRGSSQSGSPEASVDRSLDVAYPVTYYSDVTDADSATPIPIRGGERVQVDVHLNPVPALRLLFHSPREVNAGVPGKPGFAFPQLEQPAFEASTPMQGFDVTETSPGEWELAGIPAGRYNIRMQGSGLQMNGVDLTRNGEEIDTSKGEALSNVSVTLHLAEGMAAPKQLAVGLRSKGRSFAGWQMMGAKGTTELPNISAGQYELVAWGSGNRYSVGQISAEGAEVTGHSVTIAPGTSVSLSVSVIAGNAEVQGVVKRAGKPFAGAMVVLVPKNPQGNRDLFRRDQSDLDGTFSLHGVIPGSYMILAIENGWDLDWSQPEVITAYAKHGRSIEVTGRARGTVQIGEPVEVVSK